MAQRRVNSTTYQWKVFNGEPSNTYTTTNVRRYSAAYTHELGLKTATATENGNGSGWTTQSSLAQSYAYEAQRDYLTSATYGGSTTDNWTYDSAGNRSGTNWTYDNLNRMTTGGHVKGDGPCALGQVPSEQRP